MDWLTFVDALDIPFLVTDNVMWLVFHHNRIFGTDVGYRKLKALKNAEVEFSSEQKKQWWSKFLGTSGTIRKSILIVRAKLKNVVSYVNCVFVAVLVNRRLYLDIYALLFRKFGEWFQFWDGFSPHCASNILDSYSCLAHMICIVWFNLVECNESDNLFTGLELSKLGSQSSLFTSLQSTRMI